MTRFSMINEHNAVLNSFRRVGDCLPACSAYSNTMLIITTMMTINDVAAGGLYFVMSPPPFLQLLASQATESFGRVTIEYLVKCLLVDWQEQPPETHQ